MVSAELYNMVLGSMEGIMNEYIKSYSGHNYKEAPG